MYLLDTNILSELIKRKPIPGIVEHIRAVSQDELFTSVVTVQELRYGAYLRPDKEEFWSKIVTNLLSRVRIVNYNKKTAAMAGEIMAALKQAGKPIGLADTMIGAIAMTNGLTVITRNTAHFRRIQGLEVDNWC